MHRKWWGLIVVIGLASVSLTSVRAANTTGQGLEITPPVIELVASPGQTVNAVVKLRNVIKTPIVATGKADDFGASGEEGQPKILLDETESTRYSLKFWIPSVPSVNLNPGEQKTITVPISVPSNAEPGGHYGVIRFSGTPAGVEGSGVSLSASLGTLVLLRVAGPTTEQASLAEFYAAHNGVRGSWFESGPINFTERVSNNGTVHIKPTGTLTISDLWHHQVAKVKINEASHNVLPASIRRFDQTWSKRFLFGRYRAQVNLVYGVSQTALTKSLVFWVIPWQLIGLILLALIALIVVLRSALKAYNRRVIARYRKQR